MVSNRSNRFLMPKLKISGISLVICVLISFLVKLCFIPCYHSTDLEVHGQWMRITKCLPLCEWYSDNSTVHTLDYPPLFAYFERALAFIADHTFFAIDCNNFKTDKLFMRLSVIGTEFVSILIIFAFKYLFSRKHKWNFDVSCTLGSIVKKISSKKC
ncbi:hypothetical protein ACOME3_007304 [Neoechinorhynchus agilis]